ncbi:Na+/H+ antiporter [Psychromonas ingrahamii 37]|uniref:Na+/H+ antiporter n=2 Tax=Psychromonas ingrahamii TaxID=357794 RepID=A1SVN2_PSYIN|nr:Na+/H+ antiporter [Psychromonas ingrahamii 37]
MLGKGPSYMNVVRKNSPKNWVMSTLIIILLGLGSTNTIDSIAENKLEASFSNALTTFAVVRGINAVISVVQGTEVAIEPGGVGVILTPGEILDPANDLIERFSWIVLAASTSLGAQIVLLKIGTTVLANYLVILSGSILLISIWTSILANSSWRNLLIKSAILVIFIRFLIPIVTLATEVVYSSILSPTYINSQEVLENVENDVQELQARDSSSVSDESEEGILSSIRRFYERTTNSMNISARYKEYDQKIAGASKHIINLIVVFIFQTLVFPLIFLWLAIRLFSLLINSNFWLQPTYNN